MTAAALTEQEFQEWSDDLRYIIWDCHISFKNFETLTPYLHKGADWEPITGFLDHLRTQYFFTLVTQLAKVFCEGAHSLRFTALMNRISTPPISPFVAGRLRSNEQDAVHSRFPQFWKTEEEMRFGLKHLKREIGKHKAVIKRLQNCRNEVIAHTDSVQQRRAAEMDAPSLSELKVLAMQAAETHNLIQAGLGFGSFSFDTTGSWEIEPVFRGWSGYVELHNLKGELMRMGYAGIIGLDKGSFDLKVVPLPRVDD